jgi:hypothetical protein
MSTDTDDRTHVPAVMIDRYLIDYATIADVEQIVAESQTLLEIQPDCVSHVITRAH